MTVIEALQTVNFWFGLATGALVCETVQRILKHKLKDVTGISGKQE